MFLSAIISILLLTTGVLGAPPILQSINDVSGLDGRIIGGENAVIEDFPYQVSVQVLGSHACGGVIISNYYVLTAAHCVRYPTSWYSVRAGSTIRNTGGVTVAVSTIVVHPSYNALLENDIAIFLLSSPLSFSASIAPIPLASQNQVIPAGADAVVTGWGDLFDGANQGSNILQSLSVPIVGQSDCEAFYEDHRLSVTESMLCAGFVEGGRDACQGDSGGPLAVNGVLVGLVSWGERCALPNYPGVYASIPYLRSFIADITGV